MKNVKTGHSKPRVCLDAGHYGKYNRSPAVKSYYESDMAWKLTNYQAAELESYGIEVIKTRSVQAKDKALYDRGAASKGCDLFLSNHSNAVGSSVNETVDYVVVYHLTDDTTTDVDNKSKDLASKLAPVIADTMNTKQGSKIASRKASSDKNKDGMFNDNYYGVLNGARQVGTPGLILEHSFHTNTRATEWLLNDANLKAMAAAEAKVIADWFGVEKADSAPKYYRIRKTWADVTSQKGAYLSLESAKKACPEGYSVFDWNGKAVYTNKPVVKDEYTLKEFVTDIQKAIGAEVDGIAGPETLSKTVTLSSRTNSKHAAVKFVQKRLYQLGYVEVGAADGDAGPKFTSAVAHFQLDNKCTTDGVITAKNKTWKKLLGMA